MDGRESTIDTTRDQAKERHGKSLTFTLEFFRKITRLAQANSDKNSFFPGATDLQFPRTNRALFFRKPIRGMCVLCVGGRVPEFSGSSRLHYVSLWGPEVEVTPMSCRWQIELPCREVARPPRVLNAYCPRHTVTGLNRERKRSHAFEVNLHGRFLPPQLSCFHNPERS